ncbi:MAG: HAMP domain-containing protein, partial [Desulfobacterales bacterium]|nr:HAMP domain-containing protein [Desulfobacterales bacterium]
REEDIYLVINLLVLLFFSAWRFSRMMTRPIQRLIRITDEYEASEDFEFFPEKQKDEFRRLSGSLNRMVRRIEADRDQLRESLDSLEKSNRQLKEAQNEIVRAEKLASIGRLSAGIAHEIGNPVGIVLGYLGLLKSRCLAPDDELGKDYIERAESEIQRVNTIIRQLLDFSRNRPSNYSVLSLHDLVREAGEMLSQQPMFSDIVLEYKFGAENDRVHADADQLHQVMVNLMINAADSIKQAESVGQGSIRLATRGIDSRQCRQAIDSKHGAIELKVIDNGTGIEDQYLDKIFDPFFTTKETGKGTGLGLSVSYMMIRQMGGGIDALPGQDGGTQIVIELPVCTEADKSRDFSGNPNNTCQNGKVS